MLRASYALRTFLLLFGYTVPSNVTTMQCNRAALNTGDQLLGQSGSLAQAHHLNACRVGGPSAYDTGQHDVNFNRLMQG